MTDIWADWLRTRRTGGDAEYETRILDELTKVRDRVLDNADLRDGETLVDVGCGNGLIAFGALERGVEEVVFADISRPLLEDCRDLAAAAGVLDRCRFVESPATDLEVEDGSVSVVTTRSVLIYVEDKKRAFQEFHRVLEPGGRISLFEPINRFGAELRRSTWGYDLQDVEDLFGKVNAVYDEIQPPTDPMLDFDERNLLTLADDVGFFPITMDYRARVEPPEPRRWDTFVDSAFNPKVPTLAEAMERTLTAEEQERLVSVLRPAVEEGRGEWHMGQAYLWAVKP